MDDHHGCLLLSLCKQDMLLFFIFVALGQNSRETTRAFDIAFHFLSDKHPDLFRHVLTSRKIVDFMYNDSNSEESSIFRQLYDSVAQAKSFRSHRRKPKAETLLPIIIVSGASDEQFTFLGDLARENDVAFLITEHFVSPVQTIKATETRFPTLLLQQTVSAGPYQLFKPEDHSGTRDEKFEMLSTVISIILLFEMLSKDYLLVQSTSGRFFASSFANLSSSLEPDNDTLADACTILKLLNVDAEDCTECLWTARTSTSVQSGDRSTMDPYQKYWGYSAEQTTVSGRRNTVAGIISLLVVFLIAFSGYFAWRKMGYLMGYSWMIQEKDVTFVSAVDVSVGRHELSRNRKIKGAILFYKNSHNVVACSMPNYFSPESVKKNRLAKMILNITKAMDHPNLIKFYGLLWTTNDPYYGSCLVHVSEVEGIKSFLRNIIDNDQFAFNWDLRFAMMWDIIEGLRYIHKSLLRYHGTLSTFYVVIDDRYTAKINAVGMVPFIGIMMRKTPLATTIEMDASVLLNALWLAPEVIFDIGLSWSAGADSYSFGVILYELSTRNGPFNVELQNQECVARIIQQIKSGALDVSSFDMSDVPSGISELIKSCWSREPADRPSLSNIVSTLIEIYPQREGMSFSDSLVDRMMHYSRELEERVAEETANLIAETHRVDLLLANLLPTEIIQRLRNNEVVVPEFYNSVTIMFSDCPVFNEIVSQVAPFELFTRLTELCIVVDHLVSAFSVFKVEAIRDCYMLASGVPQRIGDRHAPEMANLAVGMLTEVRKVPARGYQLEARIGIHSGPCVASVIGQKLPHYTIFGDTVNMASRMETSGEISRIQVSKSTRDILLAEARSLFLLQSRGFITIKGKGEVETFWLSSGAVGNSLRIRTNTLMGPRRK